jgi:amino acid transporter
MTERPLAPAPGGPVQAPIQARLEPDAIGVAQDTVIGMANTAPTISIGLSLAGLAAAMAYAGISALLLCGVVMLVIANSYRRLNLWNANCGASFEWVGRSMNPYLGFMTGWLMIAGNLTGAISGVVVLAPSVLAIFGSNANSTAGNIAISTVVVFLITIVACVGIRPTARLQVGMAAIEYSILIGFCIAGLIAVLGHHHGTYPITSSWFSLNGIGGKGDLSAGILICVFMYSGWDATVYVNEEVKHRRVNPGRAAIIAVVLLGLVYIFGTLGLQGTVSPAKLQANSSSLLIYIAQALGGGGWSKVMALALALAVVASTGVGIVALARILYGMASHRVLPPVLGRVSQRFATPIVASIVTALALTIVMWVYLLSGSVANAFNELIDITGLLYAAFYVLTALAAITYYRRRVFTNFWDGILVGLLPLAAAAFLVWVVWKSLASDPWSQRWSVIGVVAAGIVVMFLARFVLQSSFFRIPRESASATKA